MGGLDNYLLNLLSIEITLQGLISEPHMFLSKNKTRWGSKKPWALLETTVKKHTSQKRWVHWVHEFYIRRKTHFLNYHSTKIGQTLKASLKCFSVSDMSFILAKRFPSSELCLLLSLPKTIYSSRPIFSKKRSLTIQTHTEHPLPP